MIIGWKAEPMGGYFFGRVGGANRKLIRIIAGVILPSIFGRQSGVMIVLAEQYRPSAPMDLTAIAATAGEWPTIENALVRYRKDLKVNCLVVDSEEAAHIIKRIAGLNYAMAEIPMLTYTAPKSAFGEAGKQCVDSLVAEGRLHRDDIQHILDAEPELGLRALQAAVTWADEHRAVYHQARRKQQGRPLGTVGL